MSRFLTVKSLNSKKKVKSVTESLKEDYYKSKFPSVSFLPDINLKLSVISDKSRVIVSNLISNPSNACSKSLSIPLLEIPPLNKFILLERG